MGVVAAIAGLYMCDLVKKFTFAISSPDEFLFPGGPGTRNPRILLSRMVQKSIRCTVKR